MRVLGVGLALLLAGAAFTARAERAEPPPAVAPLVRALLDREALVVRDGPDTVMRVWFRREIPVRAIPAQGLSYREIPEGTLVGALEFPRPFTDFRRQRLPAGVYTLRFAIQPDTGEHTDTAPHREFCLLSPAAADTSDRPMDVKALIELSSRVNEGRHPAVLLLWPNDEADPAVKVVDKGNGVQVANVRRPVRAGDRKGILGFGITVAGVRKL